MEVITISKKFYQLKLTDFECGWTDLEEDIREFPEGIFMIVDDCIEGRKKVWYNPYGTYKNMIKDYDNIAASIKVIIDRGIKETDLPELFRLDILLYDLVMDFMLDGDYSNFGEYKSKNFDDITPDFYELYMDKHNSLNLNIQEYKLF